LHRYHFGVSGGSSNGHGSLMQSLLTRNSALTGGVSKS
jgi:hypothetical protein